MGMIVMMRGSLQGMGREAECEVVARKQIVVSTRKSESSFNEEYSDIGVIEAPVDLPDGDYTVRVANYTFTATRRNGLWLNRFETMTN